MEHLEKSLSAFSNRQFPAGDASDSYVNRAHEIHFDLKTGNKTDQFFKMQRMIRMQGARWENLASQKGNDAGLKQLSMAWGHTLPDKDTGYALVISGIFSTHAFMGASNLLPTTYADLSEELFIMSSHDKEMIERFAANAWEGMELTHPAIHGVLQPYLRHLYDLQDVTPDFEYERVLIKAGAALPYLMAATTRAEGYMSSQLVSGDRWVKVIENLEALKPMDT